ncbi:hypothetical protein Tco_0227512 [Tanacetum coccineum]
MCYHGYGVTGFWLRRNTFEDYKLKTFLHNSVSNFPQPILGFGNKVYSRTSDRRKVEQAIVMDPNSSLGEICLGENIVEISSDKVEGSGDWNSPEFQDTANSG